MRPPSTALTSRQKLTRHACRACRKRKAKCDATRPTCARCQKLGYECHYDVSSESITRVQKLKMEIDDLNKQVNDLNSVLGSLKHASEDELRGILAEIRNSHEPDSLCLWGAPYRLRADFFPPSPSDGSEGDQYPCEVSPLARESNRRPFNMMRAACPAVRTAFGETNDCNYCEVPHIESEELDAPSHWHKTSRHPSLKAPLQSQSADLRYGWSGEHTFQPTRSDICSPSTTETCEAVAPLTFIGLQYLQPVVPLRIHLIQPMHIVTSLNSTSPSHILSGQQDMFVERSRQSLLDLSVEIVVGSAILDASDILQKSTVDIDQATTVQLWSKLFMWQFHYLPLPERIAMNLLLLYMTRWLVFPCVQTYADIPMWLRPSAASIQTPHLSIYNLIPWMALRELMLRDSFDFALPFFNSVSVNWPHCNADLFESPVAGKTSRISDHFITHVSELSNWTLSLDVLAAHPEIYGKAKFRSKAEQ